MPNEATVAQQKAIVEKLRAKRSEIAKLPPQKQLDVYGVAFDRFQAPRYKSIGLKPEELQKAKDQWIVAIVEPHLQEALPEHFGERPAENQFPRLEGLRAGFDTAVDNIINFGERHGVPMTGAKNKPTAADKLETHEAWERAVRADPDKAKFYAGVGKAIPSVLMFEGGAGVVPQAAKTAPLAWRAISYLTRQAAGTAAMTTAEEKPTTKEFGTQLALGVLLDGVLHGATKGVIKTGGALGTAIGKLKSSAQPNANAAGQILDELTNQVLKEKFPNKTLDKLTPTEFDHLVTETKAKRAAIEAQGRTAAQAVKDAEKANKPTKKAQILQREQDKAAKSAARKAESEKLKRFSKALSEYKQRVGSLPTADSEHMKALQSGKTPDEILGPKPEVVAAQAVTGVKETQEAQAISEGAPQAVQAVEAIKSMTSDNKKTKKPPMFDTDVSQVIGATSPEEFASAKKTAKNEATRKAQELAKSLKSASEGISIAHELKKEHHRIDSIPTPSSFSVKTKDAARKATEASGTAGSEDVEKIASSRTNAVGPDAETEMLRNEQLLEQLKDVGSEGAVATVTKALKGKETKMQNAMLEAAIEALSKAKKQ